MEKMYILAAVWLGMAVLSTVIAYHLRISIALIEICIGMGAAFVADRFLGKGVLGSDQEWLRFLASSGAVLLTFLAGAELDPKVLSSKKKEVVVVGFVGFLAPFLGCMAVARWVYCTGLLRQAGLPELPSPPHRWPSCTPCCSRPA